MYDEFLFLAKNNGVLTAKNIEASAWILSMCKLHGNFDAGYAEKISNGFLKMQSILRISACEICK